jgi:hypothetical protein
LVVEVLVLVEVMAQTVEFLFLMVSLQLVVAVEADLLVIQVQVWQDVQEVQEEAVWSGQLQELLLVEPQMQQHKVMLVDSLMEGVRAIQEQEVEVQDSREFRLGDMETISIKLVVTDSIPLSQVHIFGEEEEVQVLGIV